MITRIYTISLVATLLLAAHSNATAHSSLHFWYNTQTAELFPADSVPNGGGGDDSSKTDLKYPIEDRQGDHITNGTDNPFELNDPGVIEKNIEYDPETDRYIITETLDGRPVRPPTYMSFEEYLEYESEQSRREYYNERLESISLVERQGIIPKIYTKGRTMDRLFGGSAIDIRPSGNIDITLGGNVQRIDNPILTEQARTQGGFDFDMNINMNVIGSIGDKLKINLSYNTGATFDFENQIKLKYEGEEDDIIKLIEAGNVSFPLNTSLIRGTQSLFGVHTKLQFGRLTISNVFSQQRSQTQNLTIQDGAQTQFFEVFSDEYDENRHYFLTQFFRDSYNEALSNLPNINSLVQITRLEVWVTNRTGATQDVRDIVAFQDLAEPNRIHSPQITPVPGQVRPNNNANSLYGRLTFDPSGRTIDNVSRYIQSLGLQQVDDYEKTFARQLTPTEYTFHPQLGYISLNQALYPDEVLAVAFEYTFNGEVYKVGEFSQEVPPDSTAASKVLYLKMLKSTAIRPELPMWDLMMKNIYSIGAYQVNQEDFRLEVFYQDPGGGLKRFVPGGSLEGKQLINVLNMDNLNNQNDPQRDGVFDYLPGVTINPNNGRIIFTTLEPFGDYLREQFTPEERSNIAENFVYDELYDSIRIIAQQYPQFNRYVLKGQYKSSVSSEISLGAFNVPEGSVTVTAGGQQLVEGRDYTVDYSLGRVKIINEGILNSGVPINVGYENNALFGFQQKTMFGTRLDYRVSEKFNLGATYLHLKERPFTPKVNVGDDPISNGMWGFDFNYSTESQFLTWLVDKLPLYSTKETSTFSISGEMARLKPGHSRALGQGGVVYIDDFEGASSSYDLKFPANNWRLASVPRNATNGFVPDLFPEAEFIDSLLTGFNRARLAWYNIDPELQREVTVTSVNGDNIDHLSNEDKSGNYVRQIIEQEVFPNRSTLNAGVNPILATFDLAFYPEERGPYNFENKADGEPGYTAGINPDGTLKRPETRWGGVMRSIDNNNFEAANIEFLEIWVMDPFLEDSFSSGGSLFINMGNISEDVLKDSRFFYENGLPTPASTVRMDTTNWARVPRIQPIVNAFDNDPENRAAQDLGYDGWNDEQERDFYQAYIDAAANVLTPEALAQLQADPSQDNFLHEFSDVYADRQASILERYKRFSDPQGNSPAGDNSANGATNLPDSEDLNRDNTVNENEQYFQYQIDLRPGMQIGEEFITDIRDTTVTPLDNNPIRTRWLQLKIPIQEYDARIGNIPDFKSIRFIRLFMTGFEDPVVLRFARLELVRNQWRRYLQNLQEPGEYIPSDDVANSLFNVIAVNIEENTQRTPIPYVLPDGIDREQNLNTQNTNALQNEQSISVQLCGLEDGDARAIFKNLNLEMRQYERMQMFVHGESLVGELEIEDGDLTVFVRLGADFTENYYEYELPLIITEPGASTSAEIWPEVNNVDIELDSFIALKVERDVLGNNANVPYSIDQGSRRYTVVGYPDLSNVKTVMLGIRNPKKQTAESPDDGFSKCAEVWFNELRLTGFDEEGGWAALARMETQLADLGNITFSANMHTKGFGQIEQKVDERYRNDFWQYDFATNVELGKFFPDKWGLRIPFYANVSQSFSTPEYDPYQLDVPLKIRLDALTGNDRREYKRQVQDRVTIRGFNFTNVRIVPQGKEKKPRFYDVNNFNVTYAYSQTERSDPLVESDLIQRYRASLGYNFAPQEKYIYPLKKAIKSRSKYLDIIKDINFNFIPASLSFSNDFNRQFGEIRLRPLGDEEFTIEPTFNKFFTWDRTYGIRLNPFKSVSLDFNAVNNARIDEPDGRIDTPEKKDTLWSNMRDFGRTTRYQHNFSATYNTPIDKIPFLSWTQARLGYNSSYTWTAAPQVLDSLGRRVDNPFGNTVANSSGFRVNGELNLKNLYDEWKVLKPYNSSRIRFDSKEDRQKKINSNQKRAEKLDDDIDKQKKNIEDIKVQIKELKQGDDEEQDKKAVKERVKQLKKQKRTLRQRVKKLKRDKKRLQAPEKPAASFIVRPLIALKRVSINFTDDRTTSLPGYTPKTRFFGQDQGFATPGLDFAFGKQPSISDLDQFADNGWITSDTNLNYQLNQTWSKNLNLKAVIEPLPDLRVDLTMTQAWSQNYAEFFKKPSPTAEFQHLNPVRTGSYNISYVTIKTAFQKVNERGINEAYTNFESFRTIIAQRFAEENPNSVDQFFVEPPTDTTEGGQVLDSYREGYGPYSTEVLIASFLAAYSGKDPGEVKLNPFKVFPLPNWRVTYNGLSKIKGIDKVIKNITVSHAYNSTFSVSSFNSNLNFEGDGYFQPSRVDTLTNNFYPLYNVPQVTISEQFAPLIGIDITWANGLTTRFDYKKTRQLSMSFIGYQLSESQTTEYTAGLGYRVKGLSFKNPFKKGAKIKLNNELNFRVDFSIRDNVTINHRLDQEVSEPTAGTKTIRVSPSIDYVINKRLNIRIFLDRNRSIPKTSASFPITNTRAGITLRFSLVP